MRQRVILLVEDNPDDEALTRRALAKNNIENEVVVARDGAEALDGLFGTGPQAGKPIVPEVILLDLKLPKIDGLEVLRRVKESDPAIEVVMITAYASLETVKLALTHGAFEYLIKPFSRQDLEDTVKRALARRQSEIGTRSQLSTLVEDMRTLSAKTRELEEEARREQAEQSLRVTQLSI
ncbi:MAG: response regulator, partial [bacterium]